MLPKDWFKLIAQVLPTIALLAMGFGRMEGEIKGLQAQVNTLHQQQTKIMEMLYRG
jgi:hypothetical protein